MPYSNWRGPMWVNANALACYGLAEYGQRELAIEIATRVVRALAADLRRSGVWHEAYSTADGRALAAPGLRTLTMALTPTLALTLTLILALTRTRTRTRTRSRTRSRTRTQTRTRTRTRTRTLTLTDPNQAAPGFLSWDTLSAELLSNLQRGVNPFKLAPKNN